MNSSYDKEVDAFYFEPKQAHGKSVRSIDLGTRRVILDVDISGNIIGVEVF